MKTKLIAILFILSSFFSFAMADDMAAKTEKLVKDAISLIKTKGKDGAINAINKDKVLQDGELYIFIFDDKGKTLAHGVTPGLVGKDMLNMTDADKKPFIKEFLTATEAGLWVEYKWTNVATKKIEPKRSYIIKHDGMFVGCGYYKK